MGRKIKQAREKQGWTQADLAERTSANGATMVVQSTIAQYEGGKKIRPDTEIINKLAKALNVSPDFLLAEDDKLAHIPQYIMTWLENPDCVPYLKKAFNEFKE